MPPTTDAITIEDLTFGSGLHGALAYPDGALSGGALVAGPHPLLGGTMQNNVVAGLGDGLAARGLVTLRFDYRGVGRSAGPRFDVTEHVAEFWRTSHVRDEMGLVADVEAGLAEVRRCAPEVPAALIGYSFGCALLPHVRPSPDAFVLIAPTLAKHEYDAYYALEQPKLVIASEDDFACDTGRLQTWFERLAPPRYLILQRFDNHFFRGHEGWLADAVFGFLREHWR
jgi:alpha/beta superfamily hydrolase